MPWIAIGDWNWLPSENEAIHLGPALFAQQNQKPLPTRWKSAHAIDYAVTTHPQLFREPALLPDVISDHKIFQLKLHLRASGKFPCAFQRRPAYEKPHDMTQKTWQERLDSVFEDFRCPDPSTAEKEWTQFCKEIETRLRLATAANLRTRCTKGAIPAIVTMNAARPSLQSFRARKLANFLGRIREAQRQSAQQQQQATLHTRIQQTWPPDIPRGLTLAETETLAEEALQKELRRCREHTLHTWKQKMRAGGTAVSRWLQQSSACLPPEVWDDSRQEGANTYHCWMSATGNDLKSPTLIWRHGART